MSEFRYTCPSCAAVLKTANAIPAGKAIKCPKCQTVFKPAAEGVAPAAAPRPAAPPPRPAAPAPAARPSGQTPAAKPPAPRAPAPPPAAVKAAKSTEAPPPADGSVQIHDHKGTVTLPRDWKKKRPKSSSNSMVLLGCLGGGLLIILVCCGGPIMIAALAPDPEPGPPRNGGGPRISTGPIGGVVRVTQGELIGTWTGKTLGNADVSYEFKPSGQVQFNQAAMKKTGRFTIQGDDMIQINWTTPPRQPPSTLRVSEFGLTEMTVQDDDGQPLTLTRRE